MPITTVNSILDAPRGARLFVRSWRPVSAPRATIQLIHGLTEHTGRYEYVGCKLAEAGFLVVANDLRGHGRSTGARGHVPRFERLLDDLTHVAESCDGPSQRFLYGHSLGGNIAINYVLRRKPRLRGLIITSPLLKTTTPPPAWQWDLAQIAYRVFPWARFNTPLDPARLSHDLTVGERLRSDPLWTGKVSARLAVDMLDAGRWALEHADELTTPMLLMHGEADQMTSAEASREFAASAGDTCRFRPWEGMHHELHHEIIRAEFMEEIIGFVNERLSSEV